MRKALTSAQQEYFNAIEHHIKKHGVFPTVMEIKEATGRRSPSGVQHGMEQLEIKGWIERIGSFKTPRGYRILPPRGQRITHDNTVCPKGLPVRAGAIAFYDDRGIVGIWTPAELVHDH